VPVWAVDSTVLTTVQTDLKDKKVAALAGGGVSAHFTG